MLLELTRDDARMLRELLEGYMPQLKREVARTEVHALRHEMVLRQELCERLLARLATGEEAMPTDQAAREHVQGA